MGVSLAHVMWSTLYLVALVLCVSCHALAATTTTRPKQVFKIGTQFAHHRFTYQRKVELQERVKKAFYHGFDSYMTFAFPADEVKPISCEKHDNFAGYAVTAVDSLDALALMGDYRAFMSVIKRLDIHLKFEANRKISVFETTIRILGGLISAHHLALKVSAEVRFGPARDQFIKSPEDEELFTYNDEMLRKAVLLADKLMPVFDTLTGIPYSETNLAHPLSGRGGNNENCPAGAGTLLMEFGALGALTQNCSYLLAAERALTSVWKHRGPQGLVGSVINIMDGSWVHPEATIGASVDSFYEYLQKAYIMFGDEKYLAMWHEAYKAIQKYTYFGGWYIMSSVFQRGPLDTLDHKFNSLTTFWPGLQTLAGDVHNALDSYSKMHCVVKKVGYFPEYLDLASFFAGNPSLKKTYGFHYPLRPEFIESTLFLYKATGDESFLEIAETFFLNLMKTKHQCGFASLKNVFDNTFEDSMESFVLAETLKYLYIIFTPSKAEVDAENDSRRELRQTRLREVALGSPAFQRRHASLRQSATSEEDFVERLMLAVEAEELQAAISSLHQGDVQPHVESADELKEIGYPAQERSLKYTPPIYDLEKGYIVNTEAHPIPLTLQFQEFSRQCEWSRKNEKMDRNSWVRIGDTFRQFPGNDRSIGALSEWESAHMCPKVDFMRDVAPFIKRQFYSTPEADPCLDLPDTQVLGERDKTHYTTKNYALVLSSNKQKRLTQVKADLNNRDVLIKMSIELPPDPLAGREVAGGPRHAGSITRSIVTELSTHVIGSAATSFAPQILQYRGMLGIPLVNDLENLYQHERSIVIRRVGPAPIAQVNDRMEYIQPFVLQEGALQIDKSHTSAVYSPTDAFFETSSANFGPKICPPGPAPKSTLGIFATAPVFRPTVNEEGCLPAHIGDTRNYPKPFGIASMRGGCTFREKALSAQLAGASFVIIINLSDDFILMGDGVTEVPELVGLTVTIPLIAVSKSLADSILPPLSKLVKVVSLEPSNVAATLPPASIISVVCARNAVEQYGFFGTELTRLDGLAVMYRKRHKPLLEAFRAVINSPEIRKEYRGHDRVQCRNCFLNINYFSKAQALEHPGGRPELDPGFFMDSDSDTVVESDVRRHYSKLFMGSFKNIADGSRLQFALAPRPFQASTRGVGLPSFDSISSNGLQSTGVVYFFDKDEAMNVAEALSYTITDGEAFTYYANMLGTWLEEFGASEVGLTAHLNIIYGGKSPKVGGSKHFTGSKVFEVNIFSSKDHLLKFYNMDFENTVFTRGHVLREMRNRYISKVESRILDVNEALLFPGGRPIRRDLP